MNIISLFFDFTISYYCVSQIVVVIFYYISKNEYKIIAIFHNFVHNSASFYNITKI